MNDRAPYGAAGGREEADIESPEQKDEFEPSLPPRQQPCPRRRPSCAVEDRVEGQDQGQQTRKGGSEANGSPTATPAHSMVPLDPATSGSEQPASSSADSQQTWPGPDFELKQVLPGSVYLWACGERDEEDENVSRPEFYAAWVVLITQAICYIGLWIVSGNHPPDESQDDGGTEGSNDYSILAVAGAMYLLLSIAAADLWGGSALLWEERGSRCHAWFWWRKTFGLALLGTFFTLIGASVRVLFYSSYENVELVIGAAAVLFVADVDEKAMGVLKNVRRKWRLFWVLEVVGLSLLLAVLAIKFTGNASSVENKANTDRHGLCGDFGNRCDIYSWYFIINSQPIAVTFGALLATAATSTCTYSWRAQQTARSGQVAAERSLVFGCAFGAFMMVWLFYLGALRLSIVAVTGLLHVVVLVCAILAIPVAVYLGQDLKKHLTPGAKRLRTAVNERRTKFLSGWGLLVFGCGMLLRDSVGETGYFDVSSYLLDLFLDAWLLSGLFLVGWPLAGGVSIKNRFSWLLMGWALDYLARLDWVDPTAHAYEHFIGKQTTTINWGIFVSLRQLVRLFWSMLVGTFLLSEEIGTHGVAFWAAASRIRDPVIDCVGMWAFVWFSGKVK